MDRIKSLLEVGFEAWPYFFLIFTYSMVFIFPKKYRKVIWFITLIIVIFFGGFKDTMTDDLLVYKHMYENYRELSLTFVEPFFVVVSYLLNILNLPFYAVPLLYFLLTILFVALAIKNLTSHLEYAFFIYLTIPGFFLNTFVEMRQCLAVSIFFYGISLLLKSRSKIAFIFFILASLIHYSSAFAFLLLLILWKWVVKPHSLFVYAIILVFSLILGQGLTDVIQYILKLTLPIIPRKYLHYIHLSENVETLKLIAYFLFPLSIILMWKLFGTNTDKNNTQMIFTLNLFLLGSFLILSSPNRLITRTSYYFLIFQLPVVPNLLFSLKTKSEGKLLIIYLFTLYFLVQYIYGVFVKHNGGFILIPYENIFF